MNIPSLPEKNPPAKRCEPDFMASIGAHFRLPHVSIISGWCSFTVAHISLLTDVAKLLYRYGIKWPQCSCLYQVSLISEVKQKMWLYSIMASRNIQKFQHVGQKNSVNRIWSQLTEPVCGKQAFRGRCKFQRFVSKRALLTHFSCAIST